MFGIGMPELILILAVALIVIGPKKLPDLARSLGRALGEFKRATSDLKDSIQLETGIKDVRESFKDVQSNIADSLDVSDDPPKKDTADGGETETEDPLAKVGEAFKAMNAEPGDTDAETGRQAPTVEDKPESEGKERS